MQHRDGEDEGEIEPVGDVDVRLGAPHDGAEEHQEIRHPHDGQPEIGVPFRLGVFLRLRDAEQIAGAGDDDEEIVAEHDEPRRQIAGEPRAAGALHDIERGGDQHVAAEGEDHRRGVQRAQAAERDPRQIEIEDRKGQFAGDVEADGEAGDAPEHGGDGRELDRAHVVVRLAVDGQRCRLGRAVVVAIDDGEHRRDAGGGEQIGVERVFRRIGLGRDHDRQQRQRREGQRQASLAEGHGFLRSERVRHTAIPLSGRPGNRRGRSGKYPPRPRYSL